ncbi:MAG: HAD hydrolase family protein [Candidatus Nomurabacteria bacterium]|jgi:hydroxymethylpyrimidine pyrophosphatase-like HAD family hydrolase|nr:HAD hydrolase family protein [Candidatus Nomurabacteria bacterium]
MNDIEISALESNKLHLLKLADNGPMVFFSGVSNVLEDKDGKLISEVKVAAEAAMKRGHFVVPVTGRPDKATKRLASELGTNNWVANAGSTICVNGKIVASNTLDGDIVKTICELAGKNGLDIMGDEDELVTCSNPQNVYARWEAALFGQASAIKRFNASAEHKKMILLVPNNFRKQLTSLPEIFRSELKRILGSSYFKQVDNLSILVSHAGRYVEIYPARKSHAINIVRDQLGVLFENTVGVGYSGSDADMWGAVSIPVAMKFAPSIFTKDAAFQAKTMVEVFEKLG